MSRPPERRYPYTPVGRPHAEQLRVAADQILLRVHANHDNPREQKNYIENYKMIRDLLKEEEALPTEKKVGKVVDISAFED